MQNILHLALHSMAISCPVRKKSLLQINSFDFLQSSFVGGVGRRRRHECHGRRPSFARRRRASLCRRVVRVNKLRRRIRVTRAERRVNRLCRHFRLKRKRRRDADDRPRRLHRFWLLRHVGQKVDALRQCQIASLLRLRKGPFPELVARVCSRRRRRRRRRDGSVLGRHASVRHVGGSCVPGIKMVWKQNYKSFFLFFVTDEESE